MVFNYVGLEYLYVLYYDGNCQHYLLKLTTFYLLNYKILSEI